MFELNIPGGVAFRAAQLPCFQEPGEHVLLEYPDFLVTGLTLQGAVNGQSSRSVLLSLLEGSASVTAGSFQGPLAPGQCIALPPETPYTVTGQEARLLRYEIAEQPSLDAFLTDGKKPENAKKRMADKPLFIPFFPRDAAQFLPQQVVITSLYVTPMAKYNVMGYDLGQQIGPHGRPFDGWITVLGGKVRFVIGDDSYILSPGDSLMMPADIVHSAEALEENTCYQLLVLKKRS